MGGKTWGIDRYITSQETNQCNLIKVVGIQHDYIGWWRSWKFRLDTGLFCDAKFKKLTQITLKWKLGMLTIRRVSQGHGQDHIFRHCLGHRTIWALQRPTGQYLVIKGRSRCWYVLGNPVTPYFMPSGFPSPSASTFAMMTLSLACANASASSSYIGARF